MRLCISLLLFACACGAPRDASPTETSDEATRDHATEEAPVDEATPEAVHDEVAHDEVAALPFEPASAVALGSMALLAERCTINGPALEAHDAFDAIRSIAWVGDANVYLLDEGGLLRRYVDVGDEACVLTVDGGFGDHGAMALGASEAERPRTLAADSQGHLYVSSPLAGTHRLTGDHVDYHCDTAGRVTVAPGGVSAFGLFGTGPARRITFDDRGCEVAEWVPVEVPSILESVSFLDDHTVLVGGQDGREGPHTARLYDLEGQPQGPAFGSDDASADDRLCYTHAAFPCAAGLCILDGNCRVLLARRSDGTIAGRADLSALTGLAAPWIVPPVHIDHGMTFFAAAAPVIDADGSRHFSGSVFRLHGL
jgi:hypothetical protein